MSIARTLAEGMQIEGPALEAEGDAPGCTPARPDDREDQQLIRRWRGGDPQAFRLLYERHRGSLLRFVGRLLPEPADAAEVAQETWLGFVNGRERYVPGARFRTFLFGIAHRRSVDYWRRRRRSGQTLDVDALEHEGALAGDPSLEPIAQVEGAGLAEMLSAAIDALPWPQREAFLLQADAGLEIDEIAAATGANRETVRSRLRYAQARLRRSLAAWA